MVHSLVSRQPRPEVTIERAVFAKAYRFMLLARVLDDKYASLYRGGGKIISGGVYLGRGQEAISAAIGVSLRTGDVFAPLIRDAAGRLAFGETVLDSLRTYMGSVLGPMRAREGNVHRGDFRRGIIPMISHLGAMIAVVNGTLLARRLRGETGTVGAASIGDGATSTGAFHEALNQAAVEKLPLVAVVADNQYAYSTPTSRQFACASLVDKAAGYGITGHAVDGTDLAECLRVMGEAVRLARAGRGPQLVVARLLRLCGHGEHDDYHYLDPKLRDSGMGRDCLQVAEQQLLERAGADSEALARWKAEASREVEEAVRLVQSEPGPDPYQETWSALATTRLRETHPAP